MKIVSPFMITLAWLLVKVSVWHGQYDICVVSVRVLVKKTAVW